MHDSVAFDGLYDRLVERNPEIKAIVADAGYKTPWISKRILDDGRIPVLPYKRPMIPSRITIPSRPAMVM